MNLIRGRLCAFLRVFLEVAAQALASSTKEIRSSRPASYLLPKVGEISRAGLAFSSGTDSAPSVGLDFRNSGTVTHPPADMVSFFQYIREELSRHLELT
jgi:hypothetical protein